MRRALILGASGFVSKYLSKELAEFGYSVLGVGRNTEPPCNILEESSVEAVIRRFHPDAVFNMAAKSSVRESWKTPVSTFDMNVRGTLHLLEAVRKVDWPIRLLLVGSSEQYGAQRIPGAAMGEEMPLCPQNPYGISKCTQESLGRLYADAFHMDIVMTRSFNHIGPDQPAGFVIPDLIQGIVSVENRRQDALYVGNLSVSRDFTDVRDVARAYRLIAEKGRPGEVYNVGSGRMWKLRDLLDKLLSMAAAPVPVRTDPERMRPSDMAYTLCDYQKLHRETGWSPQIEIEQTLREMLEHFRRIYKEDM